MAFQGGVYNLQNFSVLIVSKLLVVYVIIDKDDYNVL